MLSLKQYALHTAKMLGLFRLCRRLTRERLRILCYHGVWLDAAQRNPFNFLYMHPERFARRMAALQEANYPVLPLDEALTRLHAGDLPPCAVSITIDDGWYGTYLHMVPELTRRQLPATIYLTTYYAEKQTSVFEVALQYLLQASPTRTLDSANLPLSLTGIVNLDDRSARNVLHKEVCRQAASSLDADGREALLEQVARLLGCDWVNMSSGGFFRLMSREEARQCAEQGIDLQLHTHRHRLRANGAVCVTEEIADNRAWLAQIMTGARTHFCYPSGEWEPEHFRHLKAAGITSATTTDNGLCTRRTEFLALPRILDGDQISEIEFEAELSGFMEIKRALLSLFRNGATEPAERNKAVA